MRDLNYNNQKTVALFLSDCVAAGCCHLMLLGSRNVADGKCPVRNSCGHQPKAADMWLVYVIVCVRVCYGIIGTVPSDG